jgi:serine/threonine protein kinase
LLKYYDYFVQDNRSYFIYELKEANLQQYIDAHKSKNIKINDFTIEKIIFQIIQGVAVLHDHNLMHMNLEPRYFLNKQIFFLLKHYLLFFFYFL